jgi:hypothetical protein
VECHNSLISPCDPNLQSELTYIDREHIHTKSILNVQDRSLLMNKLKVKPIPSNGKDDCDSICEKQQLKCSKESFPFVNNCETHKEQLKCQKCLIGNDEEEKEDVYELNLISPCLLTHPPLYSCSNKFKICPCRQKNDNSD